MQEYQVCQCFYKSVPGIIRQNSNVFRGTPRDCGSPGPGSDTLIRIAAGNRETSLPRSAGILVRKGRIPHVHPFFFTSCPDCQKSLNQIQKSVQEQELPYQENEYIAVDIFR
jgi:hypothetical protein